jgi:PAS domain S-box-containing protein
MTSRIDRIHVLHVDDDREFTDLVSTFLTKEDERVEVTTASGAEAGLRILDDPAVDIDCIVSDYEMPGRNGIELLDAVRRTSPDLPFILFTSKGSEEIASRAISAGVTDYLQKKPGREQYAILANRIENAVHRHASDRELERYRRIVETIGEGVYVLDDDLRFVFVNRAMEELTGRSADELLGAELSRIVDTETTPAGQEARESLLAGDREVETVEAELRTTDGDPRCGEFRFTVFPSESGIHTVGIVRDITARREHERELETVRDRMDFALDATDSIIYEVDVETGTQTRHGPFERLYGIPSDSVPTTGAFYERAIHPDDREAVERTRREFQDTTDDRVEYEYRTHPDAGPVRWIRSVAHVHADRTGDRQRLIGLATDVTPLKRRERELERRNERLDRFVSVASHDLRNPLNVAVGALELAREECDSQQLDTVSRAHDRMRALVDDLLSLARERDPSVETEPISLSEIADRCWRDVETDTHELVVDTDGVIQADRSRLRHLLENLFRNSVEHSSTSPRSHAREDSVEHSATGSRTTSDDAVEQDPTDDRSGSDATSDDAPTGTVAIGIVPDGFYVEDDGPGIPADERDRVFDAGYSTTDEGTGLGLRIVSEVADAHGWRVAVTEGARGGARFEITGVDVVE